MFGYKVETKLVKENKKSTTEAPAPLVNAEDVQRVAKNVVKYIAIGAGAVMVTATVLDTISKIVVSKSTKEDR